MFSLLKKKWIPEDSVEGGFQLFPHPFLLSLSITLVSTCDFCYLFILILSRKFHDDLSECKVGFKIKIVIGGIRVRIRVKV